MIIHLNESIFHRLFLTEATTEEIYQKYYTDIPYETYCQILQLDPTYRNGRMGKYTKWLLNIYRKGTFREGDFNEAKQLLPIYDKYKNVVEVKDIMTLNSMGELYRVVQPYIGGDMATSKSDAARRTKEGAEKVYEDGQWLIVIPHTMEAAILYGKHTKWCTAAEESGNMFEYYNNEGPLYINIDKVNNRKYQFHLESNSFMNEEDESIVKELPDENTSIADYIGMPSGAKNYYVNALGSKSGIIVFSEKGDIEQCVARFNANKDNVRGMFECFDRVLTIEWDGTKSDIDIEKIEKMYDYWKHKIVPFFVEKHGKLNAVDLYNRSLILNEWVDDIDKEGNGILKLTNDNGNHYYNRTSKLVDFLGRDMLDGKWHKEIFVCDSEGKYIEVSDSAGCSELYMLMGGDEYVKHDKKFGGIDFFTAKESKYGFINAKEYGYRSIQYNEFISKDTGKTIKEGELERSFIDFVEKECLETVYQYESGNQTGKKEHPFDVIIPDFEERVLGMDTEKHIASNDRMQEIMEKAYISWLRYAIDYGGLLGNEDDEQ